MSETSIKKRRGTARSIVTEFKGSVVINPTPVEPEDSDHITSAKLKILSGSDNLEEVTSLEMCVDARQNSLNDIGVHLPKLKELKMSNSLILSVRDLGTSLSHLQVLWLPRCGLTDLEGIPCLSSLKELYLAYNNVSELIQLNILEHLELLDLEGNNVSDLFQVWHLGFCEKLRTLSLEGNPVCSCPGPGAVEFSGSTRNYKTGASLQRLGCGHTQADYSYRSAVYKLIPQLRFLDDVPVEEDKPECCRSTPTDWTLLKESIKDSSNNDRLENTDTEERPVGVCGVRPGSAQDLSPRMSSSSLSSRPGSARPLTSSAGSRPGLDNSDLATLEHEISKLTNGFGSVLCGNPLQAARARRQKKTVQNSHSQTRPSTRLSSYIPEHSYDNEQPSSQDRTDVYAELRSWRIEHNKRLSFIEKDRQSQVMKILHCDDGYEDDEGGHSHSFMSDDITRNEEDERTVCRNTTSVPSLSPDAFQHGTESQEAFRLSSSDFMSPSPPLDAVAPHAGRRTTTSRARRLKPHNGEVRISRPPEDNLMSNLETFKTNSSLDPQSTTAKALSPQALKKTCRPSTSLGVSPLRAQWSESTGIQQQLDNWHKPIIRSNSSVQLTPTRPRTARAALQRLPNRTLLPDRGNGFLE
ncbi:leucine-rich repeat-containing protein 56 isoform X2 [Triplophysa dalaica]|uniref:leucine-rich repeat-containing protein 56 isoform X2 n=1 Tax=Triplophysa dalaica TaxID=1582913 RepID=UPI0024DF50C7|nr:leucine-rich repeat-containing protein 56 isoform X2 [Triplophysa dalaica]